MENYKVAKVLKPDLSGPSVSSALAGPAHHITTLAFHSAGEALFAGSEGSERLFLVNALSGEITRTVNSRRYGLRLPTPSHHPSCVFFGSARDSDREGMCAVHYLSLHDNVILRRFTGHPESIDSICQSPVDDLLMSSGRDGVKLYDPSQPSVIAHLKMSTSRCLTAIDPQGLVFAVFNDNMLRLYDITGYDKGPFAAFHLADPYSRQPHHFIQCIFSPDGKTILLNTGMGRMYTFDAFDGQCRAVIAGSGATTGIPTQHRFQAAFSADSKFVISGAEDGKMLIYEANSGDRATQLEGHTQYPLAIASNPHYASFASACSNIALWLPDV